jgi:NAD+ diphosphatase
MRDPFCPDSKLKKAAIMSFVSTLQPPAPATRPAYWLVFRGDRMLAWREAGDPEARLAIPQAEHVGELGLRPVRSQYLGYLPQADGSRIDCYAAEIEHDAPQDENWAAEGLRELYLHLGAEGFALASRAIQLVHWDRTHQFCGQCGAPTETMEHERAKRCTACGFTAYPRLSPAIIIAVTRVIEGETRLLLARNHRFPAGRYSIIAGFVEPGESLEECCAREVMEEVGIRIQNIRYFGSQSWPFPNSLMLGFTAEYAEGEFQLEEAEIAEAGWFSAGNLPQIPPPLSISRQLIDWFVETYRGEGHS